MGHKKDKKRDDDPVEDNSTIALVEHKQKKKKKRTEDTEHQVEINEMQAEGLQPKKKKRKKETRDDSVPVFSAKVIDESEEIPPKKKKKFKKEKSENVEMNGASQDIHVEPTTEQYSNGGKRKKKKKNKHPDSDVEVTNAEPTVSDEEVIKKKKKKRKDELKEETPECNSPTEKTMKKKKHKRKSDSDQKCSELKMGSKGGKGIEQLVPNEQLGQWGTAKFESSDRQQKFMRLLGGCKGTSDGNSGKKLFGGGNKLFGGGKKLGSGLFGSLATKTQHANYAMTNEKAKELETKLTSQYEAALDLKFSQLRGGGLGYERPPDEGKKFYINTTATNSMKFGD